MPCATQRPAASAASLLTTPVREPVRTNGADDTATTITGRAATSVGAAAVVAAASGAVVFVIAARVLDTATNAEFLVFWSVLFGVFGVLGGLQQETTRAVANARLHPSTLRPGVPVLGSGLAVGLVAAAALLVAVLLGGWTASDNGPDSIVRIATLVLATVAFAGYSTLGGALSGLGEWTVMSRLVGAEALTRLALVGVAALVGGSLLHLEVAAAAAAAVWLVALPVSSRVRAATHALGDVPRRRFLAQSATAMVASASSAALVVGYPTLLRASTDAIVWRTSAPLVLAISLTRAPLLMPLNAYQGVAIAHFLRHRTRGLRALLPLLAIVAGVGTAGSALAALVGPPVMALVFGPDYRVSGVLLAALTAASTCLALLSLTGSCVLAIGHHRPYAVGWFAAASVSALLLLVDVPLATRSVVSLAAGPLVGVAIHLWAAAVDARKWRNAPAQPVARREPPDRT